MVCQSPLLNPYPVFIDLEVHLHNDLDHALSSAMTALQSGANLVSTSLLDLKKGQASAGSPQLQMPLKVDKKKHLLNLFYILYYQEWSLPN